MEEFSEKVALVTGAASGIGRATAVRFAEMGAAVAVADLDEEGGTETVRLIEETDGEAAFFPVDVSAEDSVTKLIDHQPVLPTGITIETRLV